MSNSKIKALINYLKKKKHKDKKYLIEFLDIQVLDDDFLLININIIPTENYSSYIIDAFTCQINEIINYGSKLIGLDDVDYQIDLVYLNGEQVSLGDYSISKKMSKEMTDFTNDTIKLFALNTYHKGERITVKFYSKFKHDGVEHNDDTFWFYFDLNIYKITLNGEPLITDNEVLLESIAGVSYQILDNYRDIIADDCWQLLNNEQDIYNCDDIYTAVQFYPTIILGNKSDNYPLSYESIEMFRNKLSDFIDGDL